MRQTLTGIQRLFLAVAAAGALVAVATAVAAVLDRLPSDRGDRLLFAAAMIVTGVVAAAVFARLAGAVPSKTVLEIDLDGPPSETVSASPIAALRGNRPMTLRDVVTTLERAGRDRRVRGLVCTISLDGAGLGTIQELRDAIAAFRARGKFAVAWADTFGEAGAGNGSYYLASAFDEVMVQPGGTVGFIGLHHDFNFVRRALDKAKVEVIVDGRYEYKNAMNQLVEKGFTPAHREASERLMESQWQQVRDGVAEARGLDPDEVQGMADSGPLLADEALAGGLIDRLAYRDEVVEAAKERAGGGRLLWLARYARATRRQQRGARIAVVTGEGAITRRAGPFNLLSPGSGIGADTFCETIRRASKDKRVKAIVLRVSSPGGSAVASETIWRELVHADEQGTPVVVSMGDVAASGGYYIAAAGRRIVAHPGTVTGSIGVITAKPVLARLKDRYGIDVETMQTAANAGILSANRRPTNSERDAWTKTLDDIYESFLQRVMTARRMDREPVHAVARGRVWTGVDAAERGLVDELGGLPVAVRLAKQEAGIAEDAAVRLVPYPKAPSVFRLRRHRGHSSDEPEASAASAFAPMAGVQAATRALGPVLSPMAALFGDRGALHAGFDAHDVHIR